MRKKTLNNWTNYTRRELNSDIQAMRSKRSLLSLLINETTFLMEFSFTKRTSVPLILIE